MDGKYVMGLIKPPQITLYWIKPKWLYPHDVGSSHIRIFGLVYHCIFSFPSALVLIFSSVYYLFDFTNAIRIRNIWIGSAFFAAFLLSILVFLLEFPRAVVIELKGKLKRRK